MLFTILSALFVLAIMFFRKWVIFQEAFFIKLFHFSMFSSDFKLVKKQSFNFFLFSLLWDRVIFQKKLMENNL